MIAIASASTCCMIVAHGCPKLLLLLQHVLTIAHCTGSQTWRTECLPLLPMFFSMLPLATAAKRCCCFCCVPLCCCMHTCVMLSGFSSCYCCSRIYCQSYGGYGTWIILYCCCGALLLQCHCGDVYCCCICCMHNAASSSCLCTTYWCCCLCTFPLSAAAP